MAENPKVDEGRRAAFKVQSLVHDIVLPELSSQDSSDVLHQLCSCLRLIGESRRSVRASKGKRAKKRDLKRKHVEDKILTENEEPTKANESTALAETIVVGLNSVMRQLSAASGQADVATSSMAVIFLSRPRDVIIYSHLPTLCAMASARQTLQPDMRLIFLGQDADTRLAEALALPRVGVVGISDEAPWQGLVSFVRERMPRVPKLDINDISRYRSVRIEST